MMSFCEKLLRYIVVVSLLLSVCVCVDYADTVTINNTDEINVTVNSTDDVLLVGGDDLIVPNPKDKVYVEKNVVEKTKKKMSVPIITITAKPSVRSKYAYRWYTTTFVNYCPHCYKYGTLANVHKYPARFEQELTCSEAKGGCGADYCGVTGKEKYSWSHYYLTKVR